MPFGYTLSMKQTICLKLETTPEQHQALLETMRAFNAGCDYVAEVAFREHSANKIALQPLVYGELRSRFGLSSQMAVRAISKACEAYKRDKKVLPSFDPHGAVIYDERLMCVKDAAHVSLLSLQGRIRVAMRYGAYQAARLDRQKGQADLILRDGVFYLYVCMDLPTPPPVKTEGYVGIDVSIVQIATDSTGKQYSGEAVKSLRKKVREHRRQLQKRKTHSAKKRLRKIARRQSRFVRDVNHCISKQIVQTASVLRKALALENLEGIRDRAQHGCKAMRWLLGNWSFRQLQQFIGYKAMMAGIAVIFVDPAYTSQECSRCHHICRENRVSQSKFLCVRCGFETNADINAAMVIEARAALSTGLLSSAPTCR